MRETKLSLIGASFPFGFAFRKPHVMMRYWQEDESQHQVYPAERAPELASLDAADATGPVYAVDVVVLYEGDHEQAERHGDVQAVCPEVFGG